MSGAVVDRSGVQSSGSGSGCKKASAQVGECAIAPKRMSRTERTRRTSPLPQTTTGSESDIWDEVDDVCGSGVMMLLCCVALCWGVLRMCTTTIYGGLVVRVVVIHQGFYHIISIT